LAGTARDCGEVADETDPMGGCVGADVGRRDVAAAASDASDALGSGSSMSAAPHAGQNRASSVRRFPQR